MAALLAMTSFMTRLDMEIARAHGAHVVWPRVSSPSSFQWPKKWDGAMVLQNLGVAIPCLGGKNHMSSLGGYPMKQVFFGKCCISAFFEGLSHVCPWNWRARDSSWFGFIRDWTSSKEPNGISILRTEAGWLGEFVSGSFGWDGDIPFCLQQKFCIGTHWEMEQNMKYASFHC